MRQEIVKFNDPLSQGEIILGKNCKFGYLFKNLLLYSQAYITQTEYIAIMIKERYTQIVNFMNPWARVWL